MSACTKGFALAMATLVVNSIGLALSFDRSPFDCGGMCADPEPPLSLFMRFFAMGFIPCSLAGIFIGWIADVSAPAPRWLRWLVLAFTASSVVVALAGAAKLIDFALVSMLPTLAAVAALERWTRAPRDPHALPHARAR
jgi:hypothetical protein